MVKATFTLDDATVAELRRAAERLHKPQSHVVREAIKDYAARIGRLSEQERVRLLNVIDTMLPTLPRRSAKQVAAELRELRKVRRLPGRLHPVE
jgi:ribbon-helix-helix CopG family protein